MSRPALEEEEDSPVGNILNLPESGAKDLDYELCFSSPKERLEQYDEVLGIEW
jgi:hypothetical protein